MGRVLTARSPVAAARALACVPACLPAPRDKTMGPPPRVLGTPARTRALHKADALVLLRGLRLGAAAAATAAARQLCPGAALARLPAPLVVKPGPSLLGHLALAAPLPGQGPQPPLAHALSRRARRCAGGRRRATRAVKVAARHGLDSGQHRVQGAAQLLLFCGVGGWEGARGGRRALCVCGLARRELTQADPSPHLHPPPGPWRRGRGGTTFGTQHARSRCSRPSGCRPCSDARGTREPPN